MTAADSATSTETVRDDTGTAADTTPTGAARTDDRLTLGRLVQERLLRRITPALPEAYAGRVVAWCLPMSDVARRSDDLDGILVYTPGRHVDPDVRADLAARHAVAIVVAAEPEKARSTDLSEEPPVFHAGAAVEFRELSQLVGDLVLARETHVFRYGLRVHRALVDLLYRGAGLAALCHQMARLSNCAVAVIDPQYHVLAIEQSRTRVHEPGALATALRAAVGDDPVDLSLAHAQPEVRELITETGVVMCVLTPILLGGRHDGWVLVVETDQEPHPHDLAEHRVVAEQGATIVGTELLRIRSVEQAEERARGDFVHALLHGRFATAHELEARAAHYDFPVSATFAVVVAAPAASETGDSLTTLFQLAHDASRIAASPGRRPVATVIGDMLVIVRQVEDTGRGPTPAGQQLREFATLLDQEILRRLGRPSAVTFGHAYTGAEHVPQSYREARLALGLHRQLKMTDICAFDDLRVYATLADLAGTETGRGFVEQTLAPLRSGRGAGSDLEQTVVAYIESGGNVNATARTLHVHRNTMLYKLDRASRLLGVDLRVAEHQFAVWLAHKLDLLDEISESIDRGFAPS